MIHVYFTDGTESIHNTVQEAQANVEETILGCDFAVSVEQICDDNGRNYACNWSVAVTLE